MIDKIPDYVSFEVAQEFAKASGIQSEEEWKEIVDLDWLPAEVPPHPEIYYQHGDDDN